MKRVLVAGGLVSFLAMSGSSFAQDTVKLLEPVNITSSALNVPWDFAVDFASKQLYLQCGPGPGAFAQLEGPFVGGGLIVDNYIQVQSPDTSIRNYCPDLESFGCFTLNDDPGIHVGAAAESAYGPVGPQDVTASLIPGLGLYTFSLMDFGYTYASSELSLRTTCAIKDKVCHFDSGKKGHKTLTVGAAAIPAHLNNHAGDYLGACTDGK